jgi:hypothetical protein
MSKASFASILDLQRTLFYDTKNFLFSEVANLPLSELYFISITGPHEKKGKNDNSPESHRKTAKESIKSMKRLGLY